MNDAYKPNTVFPSAAAAWPTLDAAAVGQALERTATETLDDYPMRDKAPLPQPAPAPKKRAPDYLGDAAATYRERNKIYGDNYQRFGHVMLALFPAGLVMKTAEDFNRLGVFVQCLSKFSRYAEQLPSGGHADSALDLATYAAMLRELTEG